MGRYGFSRRMVWIIAVVTALGVAVLGGLATAAVSASRNSGGAGSSREYAGTALDVQPAADFRLADQNGERVALSDFRGKTVVLAFLDPRCTDVCPLTAQQFRAAAAGLGPRANNVAFLAVNVNRDAAGVADVAAATQQWGAGTLPNWHFLTGIEPELRPVWQAYHVAAGAGPKINKPDEQEHTDGVYIIDRDGNQRWYVSIPFLPEGGWDGPSLSQVLLVRLAQLGG